VAILLLVAYVPPLLESVIGRFSLISPLAMFQLAQDTSYHLKPMDFLLSMASVNALAFALFLVAGMRLGRTWRVSLDSERGVMEHGGRSRKQTFRTGDGNQSNVAETAPALRLARRTPVSTMVIWIAVTVAIWGPGFLTFGSVFKVPVGAFFSAGLHHTFELLPLVVITMIASRGVSEARSTGELEVLFCSPVDAGDLVKAYWQRVWKPLRIALIMTGVTLSLGLLLIGLLDAPAMMVFQPFTLFMFGSYLLPRMVCLPTAAWMAVYFGLRMRSQARAVGYALLYTLVIPWVLRFGISIMLFAPLGGRLAAAGGTPWALYLVLMFPSLVVLLYFFFLVWRSGWLLKTRIRQLVSEGTFGV
jgi:hypothetical protein